MINTNNLAIADVIYHPRYGVVSFQPGALDPIEDEIKVRTMDFALVTVKASECEKATLEQKTKYWKRNRRPI